MLCSSGSTDSGSCIDPNSPLVNFGDLQSYRMGVNELAGYIKQTVELCAQACINAGTKCKSFSYMRHLKLCRLFRASWSKRWPVNEGFYKRIYFNDETFLDLGDESTSVEMA